jgi:tetratricopeptide (TPR) repeat protein
MRAVVRVLRVLRASAFALLVASSTFAASNEPLAVNNDTTRLAMTTTVDVAPSPEPEVSVVTQTQTNVVFLKPARSAQGVSSAALAQQAWKAFEKGQYDQVLTLADECASRFAFRAQKQQSLLKAVPPAEKAFNYSALNDVATCIFLKGKALRELRRNVEAKTVFQDIIREYRFSQCWDPKGWFWKVAGAAQDQINCIDFNIDFGDYTSETLTAKAWKAYVAHRYEAMELYVRKCVELFGADAKKMQATLSDYPLKGQESDYWALNDVATCLYIRGKALQKQGHNKDAAVVYREILDSYFFAQCFDPNGWYWKVADEAKRNLQFCG